MKHLTFLYNEEQNYKEALKESKKTKYKSVLVQIFTALTNTAKIQKILDEVALKFPKAIVIGATTAGEISHAKMYDDSTVISISYFETTKIKPYYVKQVNKLSGVIISSEICSKNTKAAIVLSEGLKGEDYEGFIKGVKKKNSSLIVAGGLAGDNFKLKETFIFLANNIYTKGAVALSFTSKKLYADNRYNLNWTPIGKEFIVTSSKDNVIYEIDNQNAVDIFKKYLGSELFKNDAAALSDFQLLYKEGQTIVSRTPMAIDGKSLVFAGPIKKGQKVQFGFSNASSVISGSDFLSKKIAKNPAEAIYVFSCIARKKLLGKVLENEFASFETIAPTAGFFTYGEFYSTSKDNALLNCTTTILVLSESLIKSKKKLAKSKNRRSLDSVTFSALTHFIKQTSSELNSNVKLLNQYKNVVDNASLVSKTDTKGYITYVNENFCAISKYTKKELLGKNHNIVRDEDVSPFVFRKMWDIIKSGKVWRGKFSNKAKDGSIYYVNATIMPIFNENGTIEEYIAIRQDITKEVQSKNRIKQKEKFIKAIFDNQDNIVVYTSKISGMISVNKKLFEYLDFKNFEDFKESHTCICDLFLDEIGYIHPEKDPNWLDTIANNEEIDHKAKILNKKGEVNTFNIKVKKIDDEYIINLGDITNLEVALQKAYSSEQAKSIFLSSMSHEIRTPLNGILGFTDVLTKKDLDTESKRYVEIIHKSGQTLLHVVNDVLDFSKIESGELILEEASVNLFLEMESSVSIFASLSKQKHINYYTFIDTSLPKLLQCDIQRIKQIVNNLISNAIKFTPEDGSVNFSIELIHVKNKKASLRFSVKDSGIGINKENLSSIFKPFSQADNSISRKYGGTGLGLAISSQYVQKMGSFLDVTSEVGLGSEFFFILDLPIVDETEAFQRESELSNINISLLVSEEKVSCEINEIVATYLSAWKCVFTKIKTIDELDKSTDILIVCAKLFDHHQCKDALDRYENLELIYIEGAQDRFECSHLKFHLIEQPMTGSSLFDKLITITSKNIIDTSYKIQGDKNESNVNFQGNILVAEDNETNQILIGILLRQRGLKYHIVNNGQEVLDAIKEDDIYDIIFMDINMPVLDGLGATKLLRKNAYSKPIVSLSANVIDSEVESFLKAGVDDTLNKPLVPKELDAILNKYLNHERENIEIDVVNINDLSKSLQIKDKKIILKLLNSFISTAQSILLKFKSQNMDADLLHLIKGASGNLRFTKLYTLSIEFEKEIESWSNEQHQNNKAIFITHLNSIVKQIELLNK